ncbi:unnamed protein product [Trichobilharzia regenti]|nr:unnamed protein product [Trichobilharzia regenti]
MSTFWVCSVDFRENSEADANILISDCDTCSAQEKLMKSDLNRVLNDQKLDGIFCVAGGWVGGNAAHRGMLAYGMAKAAVHQLTRSLAGQKSGLPDGACVIAISP